MLKALSRLAICVFLLVTLWVALDAARRSRYARGWQSHPIAVGMSHLRVERAGSVLFAWGFLSNQRLASSLAMWRSTDGITWHRVPLSPAAFPAGASIADIVRGGPGYVAVGGLTQYQRGQKPRSMVWLSSDGRTWSAVPRQPAFQGALMSAVVAGGPGLVAVGSIPTDGLVRVSQERGVVWTSTSGRSWHRQQGAAFAGTEVDDIIKDGPGLVAVGASYPSPVGSHAVVWVSRNGLAWRRTLRDSNVFVDGSAMSRVVVGPRGLAAFGATEPPNPDYRSLLWTSPDGLHWHLVPGDPLKHGLVRALIAGGPGYLAAGEQDQAPVLWSSPDGSHWRRAIGSAIFTGDNTQLDSITTLGKRLIVVGSKASLTSSAGRPTVWIWSPGSKAVPAPTTPRLDAKTFRLRFTDLPPGYTAGLDSGLLICDLEDQPDPGGRCRRMLGILGHYAAYITEFDRLNGRGEILGISIVVPDAARARQVVQDPDVVVQPLDAPPARRLPTVVHIGQELRLYAVKLAKRSFGAGESPYWNGVAGIWRDGRAIGIVEVSGTGKQAENLVVRLSRAMHRRLPG